VEYFEIQDAKNKERALKRESVGAADHKVRQLSIYGADYTLAQYCLFPVS
jgi:hypothetical protein